MGRFPREWQKAISLPFLNTKRTIRLGCDKIRTYLEEISCYFLHIAIFIYSLFFAYCSIYLLVVLIYWSIYLLVVLYILLYLFTSCPYILLYSFTCYPLYIALSNCCVLLSLSLSTPKKIFSTIFFLVVFSHEKATTTSMIILYIPNQKVCDGLFRVRDQPQWENKALS